MYHCRESGQDVIRGVRSQNTGHGLICHRGLSDLVLSPFFFVFFSYHFCLASLAPGRRGKL